MSSTMLRVAFFFTLVMSFLTCLLAAPTLAQPVTLSARDSAVPAPVVPFQATLGSQISDEEESSWGMVYNDHSNPRNVIKAFFHPKVLAEQRPMVEKEVKALHAVGDLINWGHDGKKYYIRMRKVDGLPLTSCPQYRSATADQKEKMMNDVIDKTAAEILMICQKTGLHHYDYHSGNVLVVFIGNTVHSVGLIDWGSWIEHDGGARCDSKSKIATDVKSKFAGGKLGSKGARKTSGKR